MPSRRYHPAGPWSLTRALFLCRAYSRSMTSPTPYLHFPGTAREALGFYAEVFGGELTLHTFADFGRDDGPGAAIAHGVLTGPVSLYAADAVEGDPQLRTDGLMFALLGAAEPAVLRRWYARLASEGTVVDELQRRPWGASDGQVRDRYGLLWLIGFEHQQAGDLAPATTSPDDSSSTDR